MDNYDFEAAYAKLKGFDLPNWKEPTFLYKLDVPFLFYVGENERCMPDEFGDIYLGMNRQEEICSKMRNVKSIVIPNQGHLFPIKEILPQILDFLENN